MVNGFQPLTVFAKELHYKCSKFASDLNKFISLLNYKNVLKDIEVKRKNHKKMRETTVIVRMKGLMSVKRASDTYGSQ